MTNILSKIEIHKKIIITFDICSSTTIIEDLHKTENIDKWRNFLIRIKKYLKLRQEDIKFTTYKFTGDGWILLFDYETPGNDIIDFLKNFCVYFKTRYSKYIEYNLESPPEISGLTFGIDRGSIVRLVMNRKIEWVGRSINVACRLQSAIKDNDKKPQYKVLMTKQFYVNTKINAQATGVLRYEVVRKLRNISENRKIKCIKIKLDK